MYSDSTFAQALQYATQVLHADPDADARLDGELLLAHALGKSRTYIKTWPERKLTTPQHQRFEFLIARRARGEPVAYIMGEREFWSMSLRVTADTLIPRPETELLVELALERMPADSPLRVADLGTGSGAIALALAHERPHSQLVAVDISPAALQVARENAKRYALDNIEFRYGSWLEPCAEQSFDIIVSNPPYVGMHDIHLHRRDLRFEPQLALSAGEDGLAALRAIIATAPQHLRGGAWLLVEHGSDQASRVRELFNTYGYKGVNGFADYSRQARVMLGQSPF